ncbi:hypothetical protein DV738_g1273, partial [Chaetothyriales sp. CBS 135597]
MDDNATRGSCLDAAMTVRLAKGPEQPDINSEREDSVAFAGLLPLPIILETLDIYFTWCHNQPYSFFHEESFRTKLSQGKIPDHLLFAILASAVRFSKNPFFDDIFETALFYSNKSWQSIVSSCFSANKVADLMTVQTVTLLAILDYTAGRGRHGSAWVKIGLAVRIAQDLRLMLESATHLPYSEQEERRRTFWSVYLLDRLAFLSRSFDTAWEHSKRMANLFREVRQAGAIAQASFYGYCTVVAGTIAALYLDDPSEAKRMEAATYFQMHLNYLDDIGCYWKNVSSMSDALRKFSEDASRFSSLSSDSRLLEPLGLEDCETLWTMVDYSSMSDGSRVVQSQASDSDLWMYTNANWQDIFGVIDAPSSTTQPGYNSTLRAANYAQPADAFFTDQFE